MTTNPQLACCNPDAHCELISSTLVKDIYPPSHYPAPAIIFSILCIIYAFLAVIVFTNIRRIRATWKRINVKPYLTMNILIFMVLAWRFGYLLDGPIQLISQGPGIGIVLDLSLEMLAICFLNISLAYSSGTWIEYILLFRGMWENRRLVKIIRILFIGDIIFLALAAAFNIYVLLAQYEIRFPIDYFLASLTTLVNSFAFSGSCYKLGSFLADMYDFDASMDTRVKVLQKLAIIVGLCSPVRVINDLLKYFYPTWQQYINLTTYCSETLGWSLYLFFYFSVVEIIPIIFFLLLFRPVIRSRRRIGQTNTGDEPLDMSQTRTHSSGLLSLH